MKVIPIQDRGEFRAADVIRQIVKVPGRQGIDYEEMNKRCRVLNVIDLAEKAGAEKVALEDADHQTLLTALKGFTFGVADPGLLAILDDIKNAKEPEKITDSPAAPPTPEP